MEWVGRQNFCYGCGDEVHGNVAVLEYTGGRPTVFHWSCAERAIEHGSKNWGHVGNVLDEVF